LGLKKKYLQAFSQEQAFSEAWQVRYDWFAMGIKQHEVLDH